MVHPRDLHTTLRLSDTYSMDASKFMARTRYQTRNMRLSIRWFPEPLKSAKVNVYSNTHEIQLAINHTPVWRSCHNTIFDILHLQIQRDSKISQFDISTFRCQDICCLQVAMNHLQDMVHRSYSVYALFDMPRILHPSTEDKYLISMQIRQPLQNSDTVWCNESFWEGTECL